MLSAFVKGEGKVKPPINTRSMCFTPASSPRPLQLRQFRQPEKKKKKATAARLQLGTAISAQTVLH